MMAALPPDAAAKLSKVCVLLGFDYGGERSTAAYQATRILKSHGLYFTQTLLPDFIEADDQVQALLELRPEIPWDQAVTQVVANAGGAL